MILKLRALGLGLLHDGCLPCELGPTPDSISMSRLEASFTPDSTL
jgi:hypothetical protein